MAKIQHNLITIGEVLKKETITQEERNNTISLIQATVGGTQATDTANSAIQLLMQKKIKVSKEVEEQEDYHEEKDGVIYRKNVKGEVYAVKADETHLPFNPARTGFGEDEAEALADLEEKIAPAEKTEVEQLEDEVNADDQTEGGENETPEDDKPKVESFTIDGDAFTATITKNGQTQYRKNGALISKDDYEAAEKKANGDADDQTEGGENE